MVKVVLSSGEEVDISKIELPEELVEEIKTLVQN